MSVPQPPQIGPRHANRVRRRKFPNGLTLVDAAYFSAPTPQTSNMAPFLLAFGPARPRRLTPPDPETQAITEARPTYPPPQNKLLWTNGTAICPHRLLAGFALVHLPTCGKWAVIALLVARLNRLAMPQAVWSAVVQPSPLPIIPVGRTSCRAVTTPFALLLPSQAAKLLTRKFGKWEVDTRLVSTWQHLRCLLQQTPNRGAIR